MIFVPTKAMSIMPKEDAGINIAATIGERFAVTAKPIPMILKITE
jgi:hypothetical protein